MAYHFNIDQDIVKIYYDKDVELFSKDLIDVTLKTCRSIRKSKKHVLVLEIAVLDTKNSLLFVTLSNPHHVLGTS